MRTFEDKPATPEPNLPDRGPEFPVRRRHPVLPMINPPIPKAVPRTYPMKLGTVDELMAILQRLPKTAKVLTEGCDCIDDAGGVQIDFAGDVTILRKST